MHTMLVRGKMTSLEKLIADNKRLQDVLFYVWYTVNATPNAPMHELIDYLSKHYDEMKKASGDA